MLPANETARAAALDVLRAGELLLFPTETVYGIGGDAQNPAARARLAAAKGRAPDKPFQWLVADIATARRGSSGWDERAERLARAFWPGPLTLVVSSGETTIGWRMPRGDWLLGLLRAWGAPLAASSANPSGASPPKSCAEAVALLGETAALAVDGGPIPPGAASSVAQLTRDGLLLLRRGAIPEAALRAALA